MDSSTCQKGILTECLNNCSHCSAQNIYSYDWRNQQCMNVCGARLQHAFTNTKSICQCVPRTEIHPCSQSDDEERRTCFLRQGYQYWDKQCPKQFDTVGGGALETNDSRYMACDFTFPYDNDLKLQKMPRFRGEKHDLYVKRDGGYVKYDLVDDNIVHVAMNPRQGNANFANAGIMKTVCINPKFQASKLTSNQMNVSINTQTNLSQYSNIDKITENALDNRYVRVKKGDLDLSADMFTCQYGNIRIIDNNYDPSKHLYSVFGLGPINSNGYNFSLDWNQYDRRCNEGFGTQQSFGINGSHFPILYVVRRDTTNKKVDQTFAILFDHYRKVEYFFEDLPSIPRIQAGSQGHGIINIRTREPEWRFYVITGDNVVDVRQKFMRIAGHPPIPVRKCMGLWISRFGYRNWDQLLSDSNILRENHFPTEGFFMDLYWYGHFFPGDHVIQPDTKNYGKNWCHLERNKETGNQLGIFRWDTEHFPNPTEFCNNLYKKYQYGITLIEEPYLTSDAPDWSHVFNNGMVGKLKGGSWASPSAVWLNWLGKHVAMADFTGELQNYWYTSRIKPLITDATFTWWNDLSEPEELNENAIYQGVGQVDDDTGEMLHEMIQAPEVANVTQFLWSQGLHKNYTNQQNKRFSVLTRAGTIGIQRFGVHIWPGDTNANWMYLQSSFKNCCNLMLSGVDYTVTDSGGFSSSFSLEQQQRIYSPWFANSCAINLMIKPHKWVIPTSDLPTTIPAVWGNPQANLNNVLERYQFSPHYYSWAYQISENGSHKGEMWVTPLFLEYQNDYDLYSFSVDGNVAPGGLSLLVGKSLLYCLYRDLIEPYSSGSQSTPGEKSRIMLFPKNTFWYDYRNFKWVTGQVTINFDDKVNGKFSYKLPLFVKDQSIIPTRVLENPTEDVRLENLPNAYDVLVFSKDEKEVDPYMLYEDDGITYSDVHQTFYQLTFNNGQVSVHVTGMTPSRKPKFNSFLISSSHSHRTPIPTSITYDTHSPLQLNIKNWIKKNGILFVIVIVIILVILFFVFFSKRKRK